MAGSVNKVILIGNLGKDPEVRNLENGAMVVNFPLATTEQYKDKRSGEKISQTEWHNVVLWRGLAEIAAKYLQKGAKIYVEGKLRTRSWQDQEGNTRYTTEIIGDNLTMLGKLGESTEQSDKTIQNKQPINTANLPVELANDEEDDLPF